MNITNDREIPYEILLLQYKAPNHLNLLALETGGLTLFERIWGKSHEFSGKRKNSET